MKIFWQQLEGIIRAVTDLVNAAGAEAMAFYALGVLVLAVLIWKFTPKSGWLKGLVFILVYALIVIAPLIAFLLNACANVESNQANEGETFTDIATCNQTVKVPTATYDRKILVTIQPARVSGISAVAAVTLNGGPFLSSMESRPPDQGSWVLPGKSGTHQLAAGEEATFRVSGGVSGGDCTGVSVEFKAVKSEQSSCDAISEWLQRRFI